ncbi:MAG: hypothetical protein HC834_04375, partial [Rhodospirillales bacterium]|nr:hypothetical protein [Rhodospirillales bacterium]
AMKHLALYGGVYLGADAIAARVDGLVARNRAEAASGETVAAVHHGGTEMPLKAWRGREDDAVCLR